MAIVIARAVLGLALLASLVGRSAASYCYAEQKCWPGTSEVAKFIKTLSNATDVFTPYGPKYHMYLSHAFASTGNSLKTDVPGLIVHPGSEKDLSAVLRFAAKYRIRVVAKCSGHDQNGRSTGRSVIQVVMTKFKGVLYNETDHSVSFESGLNHGELYAEVAEYDRVVVGGQFKTVCPAGCLTGGCHGPLTRQHGLGIDNVLAVRIALYDGKIITATATNEHKELLHALLGGGPSSFGVIVGFKVKSHPAPPAVYQFSAKFSFLPPNTSDLSPNVLGQYWFNTTWWRSLPLGLSGYLTVADYTVSADLVYTGGDVSEAMAAVGPLLASPYLMEGSQDMNNFTSLADYSGAMYSEAGLFYRKFVFNSLVLPDEEAMTALTTTVFTYPSIMVWIWYTYGGATANGTAGCVPHGMRHGMMQINTAATWLDPEQDEDQVATIAPAVPVFYQLGNTSYTNEYTSWSTYNVPEDWKTRFFTGYDKLLSTKKKYDPCNLYSVQFGIGSDKPKATCRGNKNL